MRIDENFVQWVDTKGRKVIMSVDGQESGAKEVATGLPQGSPVSPVLLRHIWQTYTRRWRGKWMTAEGFLLWMILREWWRGTTC